MTRRMLGALAAASAVVFVLAAGNAFAASGVRSSAAM